MLLLISSSPPVSAALRAVTSSGPSPAKPWSKSLALVVLPVPFWMSPPSDGGMVPRLVYSTMPSWSANDVYRKACRWTKGALPAVLPGNLFVTLWSMPPSSAGSSLAWSVVHTGQRKSGAHWRCCRRPRSCRQSRCHLGLRTSCCGRLGPALPGRRCRGGRDLRILSTCWLMR
jgi:hypothetical protein